jgi:hypothetical protein
MRNGLADLAEQDSIFFAYTFVQAEDFIRNNILRNQLPLDLIIIQNNIRRYSAVGFYPSITKDKDATYSNLDFYFHKIPVILIVDEDENKNAFLDYLQNVQITCHIITWHKWPEAGRVPEF